MIHASLTSVALMLAASLVGSDISVTQIDVGRASAAFVINPDYDVGANSRRGSIKAINYYNINLPHHLFVTGISGFGYLPVELHLNDGSCYSVSADYESTFRNTKIDRIKCKSSANTGEERPALSPRPGLRLVSRSFGFDAWQDDKDQTVLVTNAWLPKQPILFSGKIKLIGISALRSPDAPLADMTLVGDFQGKPSMITVELVF